MSVKSDVEEEGYTFCCVNDDTEVVWGAGGAALDENGNETILSAQEIMAEYSDTPQVDTDDAEGITHYVKITRDNDGSYPYESTTDVPEEGKESYTQINGELRIHID
ncbi:MAG: hypothetical protein NC307_07960 [Roseburia sp.]|nr:hypothetical protein [Roseburia sp.]